MHKKSPGTRENISLKLKLRIMIATLTLSINLSPEHSENGGAGRNLIVETDKLLKSFLGKIIRLYMSLLFPLKLCSSPSIYSRKNGFVFTDLVVNAIRFISHIIELFCFDKMKFHLFIESCIFVNCK